MSSKRKLTVDFNSNPPKTLDGHPFYGLDLVDPEQLHFRDSIWDESKRIIFCDAVAGSGKTTIAVAVACLLYHYRLFNGCFYIRTNSSERLGFLPGDLSSKERPYMTPLYNTMISLGENPYVSINDGTEQSQKMGCFFTTLTDAYILGSDWSKKVIIIDEAQCMTIDALKAVITRAHDDCKVICIGSSLQIQGIQKHESGFKKCIEHFSGQPWAEICSLTKNYRGEMSAWADKM